MDEIRMKCQQMFFVHFQEQSAMRKPEGDYTEVCANFFETSSIQQVHKMGV